MTLGIATIIQGSPLTSGHLSPCVGGQWRSVSAVSIRPAITIYSILFDRNPPMTQRQRPEGKLDRSWTMTRTERTRPTSRERVCSSSMMSGGTPRRRRGALLSLVLAPVVVQRERTWVTSGSNIFVSSGPKTETGSCGRTKVAGSTTGSGRRSRRPRAGRS